MSEEHDLQRALLRLANDPDFKAFLAHLDTRKDEAMRVAATATDMETIYRAQGIYRALHEAIGLAEAARRRSSDVGSNHRGTVPASPF